MNVGDKTNICLVRNYPQSGEFNLEILKTDLLASYPDGIIMSGPRYADLGGDADVDAALVHCPRRSWKDLSLPLRRR